MNTFGEKLKKAREEKKLTLKEAADGIGLKSLSTLNSYELNYRMPGLKTIIKIAKFYDVSLDYLLGINKNYYINKDKVLRELEILKSKITELEKYIDR
jgi:transcriptional regulator with XRE-family HTH domain